MNWLIQDTLFNEKDQHEKLILALKNENVITLPYTFWEEIIDLRIKDLSPKTIFPFGTCSLAYYGIKNNWNTFWDEKYTYSGLLKLEEDFINNDLKYGPLSSLQIPYDGKIYLREDTGFNTFKGTVVSCYAWEDVINGMKRSADNEYRRDFSWHAITDETIFTYSSVKKIVEEYRVFIVKNKVVTLSRYSFNGELVYTNADNNNQVIDFVYKIIPKLEFNTENFVLDIFKTDKGLKVGEVNCIHCSGWYDIDVEKLIKSLL